MNLKALQRTSLTGYNKNMDTKVTTEKKAIGPRSLPKAITERQTGKVEVYAYTIKDAAFGEFNVLNTANAWWLDNLKVNKLIDAFKFDCSVGEAMYYAGITRGQWEYFNQLHPDFSGVEQAAREHLGLIARRNFAKRMENGDAAAVDMYLKKKHKLEFSNATIGVVPGQNGQPPQLPGRNAIVFVDFGEPLPPGDVTELPHAESQ